MVLPHRIELWTSPLPRGCSTTELRQRRKACGLVPERGGNCHKGSAFARMQAGDSARFANFTRGPPLRGAGRCRYGESMTSPSQESPPRPARKPSRSERLAAELRANLRRRKAQAKARNTAKKASSGEK